MQLTVSLYAVGQASVADSEDDGGWGADGLVPSPAPAVPVAPTINWSGNKPSHTRKAGTGHEAGGAPAIGVRCGSGRGQCASGVRVPPHTVRLHPVV